MSKQTPPEIFASQRRPKRTMLAPQRWFVTGGECETGEPFGWHPIESDGYIIFRFWLSLINREHQGTWMNTIDIYWLVIVDTVDTLLMLGSPGCLRLNTSWKFASMLCDCCWDAQMVHQMSGKSSKIAPDGRMVIQCYTVVCYRQIIDVIWCYSHHMPQ